MDEAERCHRLGYIAYGKLLAMGTPAELVAGSGLHTCVVEGEGASRLADRLEQAPGVEMVTRFGNALHASGRDERALAAAVEPLRAQPGLRLAFTAPALEDVFIHLMRRSADNYAA